jgi:hypothetical protein
MATAFFPRDELFMRLAIREAERALEHDDVPVGAVIVAGGEVIGAGHRGARLTRGLWLSISVDPVMRGLTCGSVWVLSKIASPGFHTRTSMYCDLRGVHIRAGPCGPPTSTVGHIYGVCIYPLTYTRVVFSNQQVKGCIYMLDHGA